MQGTITLFTQILDTPAQLENAVRQFEERGFHHVPEDSFQRRSPKAAIGYDTGITLSFGADMSEQVVALIAFATSHGYSVTECTVDALIPQYSATNAASIAHVAG